MINVHTLQASFQSYTWKNLSFLFLSAFLIRAFVFGFFIQHEQRYWQSDSADYHKCAYSIASGNGMTSEQPIFWRTPGYPLYLAFFYYIFGHYPSFAFNTMAHKASIWVQILLTSIIPILLFFLVLSLTGLLSLAWIAAWIGVFHMGFVLSSCYILSDALSLIFFIPFLLFFYKNFSLDEKLLQSTSTLITNTLLAAFFLGLYTWIRPNGQFVALVAGILFLFSTDTIKQKCLKISLFFLFFLLIVSGWCIRNHRLTGHWFYCSMSGPILEAFTLPKVMRRLTGKPLKECHTYHMYQVHEAIKQDQEYLDKNYPGLIAPKEIVCNRIAWPAVFKHPFYCAYEWFKEVIKSTFDLYSSQIVALLQKKHKWDPLEEFLSEKFWLCLVGQPMSFPLRILIWLEFLCSLLLWLSIFAGTSIFVLWPLLKSFQDFILIKTNFFFWIKLGFMIICLLVMTGGFGYARLRLPVDPLLITLSLQFWYWYFAPQRKKEIESLQVEFAV